MATALQTEERPTVLVVEDEFIIALDLSETVRDLGYALEGPYPDKKNAFAALGQGMPDCAILDVYTGDGDVYPLADVLTEAGVPIIFHSGHVSAEDMRKRYPRAIACNKPCSPDHMIDMLQKALSESGRRH